MGRESYEKRQREKKRQERAAEKRQRREMKDDESETPEDEPDSDALMERFRVLSEQRAAGAVDAETFEEERKLIFAELGLGEPLGDPLAT